MYDNIIVVKIPITGLIVWIVKYECFLLNRRANIEFQLKLKNEINKNEQ